MNILKSKRANLFIVLSGIFITNALIAEIIGVKIFSLENTLGFDPAQIPLFNKTALDFNLTAGVIIWPIVFITTDIINEYFGKQGVKKISYLTAAFISYVFIVIWIVTLLSPANFWLEVNNIDDQGNSFNVNYAFNKLFRQGAGIIIGSLVAFLIGQLLDVFVFHKLRKITGNKKLWLRATGSTLVSQLVDSFVVLFIAFYLLAPEGSKWNITQVVSVGIINYIYKFVIALAITPLLYVAHYIIDSYLGKEKANKMMEAAAEKSKSFL
ncbi:MAG: queuosine precursor transporter [Cyclobacteriaceae bacterium]|nr:queuosine precursor transporter [Cyclobacteriaceae bacterium]